MEIKPCFYCGNELTKIHPFNIPDKLVITCLKCGYRAGNPKENSDEMIKDHNYVHETLEDSQITSLWVLEHKDKK